MLVYEGPDGTQRFPVGTEPLLIGRGAGADVRLGDLSLSARHCSLEPVGGGWKVVDLGSRNGTFVNDVLVKQRKLGDGDRVRLGRAQFRFMLSGEEGDLLTQLRRLLTDAYSRRGEVGLREMAEEFAQMASRHEAPGILVGSEELRALQNLQQVMSAMVDSRRGGGDIFEMIVDTLIEFTGAERGFILLMQQEALARRPQPRQRKVMAARNFDKEQIRRRPGQDQQDDRERDRPATTRPVIINDAPLDEKLRDGSESASSTCGLRSVHGGAPVHAPSKGSDRDDLPRQPLRTRRLPGRGSSTFVSMFADMAALALQNADAPQRPTRSVSKS